MICTPDDTLNFKNDPEIKAILSHEDIYYSGKILKVRQGIFSSNQERVILITDKAVYNLKEKEKKRRIDMENLAGITVSKISDQFIVHCKNDDEYTKYLINKKERKTNKKGMYKIEPTQLMSIREFIESGGNMGLNTHANSMLLEEEFKKGSESKYKNEKLKNFKIIKIIGKGKYSTIYLAKYQSDFVALKIFDKINLYKHNLIERVELEKNILCSFEDNRFLCYMKFYFTTESKIIFVLPFYPGGDLFNLLLEKKKLYETHAAFYAVQIVYMLSFLHSKNIIYRDLKPENIMLNENGYLTLIDFGNCKIVEEPQELESSFVGAPDYISPEIRSS